MFVRIAVGVLLGVALWCVLFMLFGVGVGLLWPEYREAARVMMQERTFLLFTVPMLFTNYFVFTAAGLGAGWVSAAVSKTSKSALATAVLLFVYAGSEHYVMLWNKLPDWYNLTIPIVIAGSVWLGGMFARSRSRQA